jgi:hypothetical protein
MELDQDRVQCWTLVVTKLNLRVLLPENWVGLLVS